MDLNWKQNHIPIFLYIYRYIQNFTVKHCIFVIDNNGFLHCTWYMYIMHYDNLTWGWLKYIYVYYQSLHKRKLCTVIKNPYTYPCKLCSGFDGSYNIYCDI